MIRNSPYRLLIVDDEKGMLKTLARIFKVKGYTVETSDNGYSALEIAKEFHPDGILMDIQMPGMDGVQTFQEVRQLIPGVIVLFMTAYAKSEWISKIETQSRTDIFSKPLDLDELEARLQEKLKQRKILIVDDDPNFCRSLSRVLVAQGYLPETAGSVEEAMQRFENAPHEIALIDMKLQDGSGLDILKEFRQRNPGILCVMVTGVSELKQEMESTVSEEQSCFCLIKPVDLDRLLQILDHRDSSAGPENPQ